jgi:hypothetical protein
MTTIYLPETGGWMEDPGLPPDWTCWTPEMWPGSLLPEKVALWMLRYPPTVRAHIGNAMRLACLAHRSAKASRERLSSLPGPWRGAGIRCWCWQARVTAR